MRLPFPMADDSRNTKQNIKASEAIDHSLMTRVAAVMVKLELLVE